MSTLTPEQTAVVAGATERRNLVVEAGAGSGKTTTLKAVADAMGPRVKGVYIGFNKVTADEAKGKFPRNFDCRTGHSLAFGSKGRERAHKLPSKRYKAKAIDMAVALGVEAVALDTTDTAEGGRWLQPDTLITLAVGAAERWYRSDRDEVSARDILDTVIPDGVDASQVRDAVLDVTRRVVADHFSVSGKLQMPHDAYRKLWALGRPQLRADVVMLDEAQDTAPVLAKVVMDQQRQQIAVGDSFQQLYKWAGAVDALAKWDVSALRLSLTQSFRFGPVIAAEANKWLGLAGARMQLRGWDAHDSRLADLGDDARAVLCRTNAGALGEVISAQIAGRRVALVGGGKEIAAVAYAARDLMNGRRTDHSELCIFESWDEVVKTVEKDESSPLRPLVTMVGLYGVDALLDATRKLVSEAEADVIVSTGHKAKGREWDSVRIGQDFAPKQADEDGPLLITQEAMMLAYVSVTRAIKALDRGPLDIVDDILSGAVRISG